MAKMTPLLERIRAAKHKRKLKKAEKNQAPAPSGVAMAMFGASALVSCILVGLALGAGIDHLLGTKPFAMIIMSLLGIAAGFVTIIRQAQKMQFADEARAKTELEAEESGS